MFTLFQILKLKMRISLSVCFVCLSICVLSGCQEQSDNSPKSEPNPVPRYIVYYNSDVTPLSAVADTIFSHVILSFIRITVDTSGELQLEVSDSISGQLPAIPELQRAGKKVLISFGGGEAKTAEYTALIGREAEVAHKLATYVKQHQLDGIDIDFEASDMLHQQRPVDVGDGRVFLISLSKALRNELPSPQFLLSHAPQPPYLDPAWHGGPYVQVLSEVGDAIDWLTVQYYNNPDFNNANTGIASYAKLASSAGSLHWPSHKLVVGKPIYKDDASSGHLSPERVITTIVQPLLKHYGNEFGGLAGWQFSAHTDDHKAWNHQVGKKLTGD